MINIHVLIGLPGSGKSTYAKEFSIVFPKTKIFSSDAIREELFNDVNNQSNNSKVFETLYNRIYESAVKDNDSEYDWNYFIDATNLSIKSRKPLTNLWDRLEASNIKFFTSAKIFITPIDVCKYRNAKRERKVPEEVIDNMRASFEYPLYLEFDMINYMGAYFVKYFTPFHEYVRLMLNFNQDNPHHSLTLGDHCDKCADYVGLHSSDGTLCRAAQLHDVGKLWTKTFEEGHEVAHFYRHENVGTYELLTEFGENMPDDFYRYINYHMAAYTQHGPKWEFIKRNSPSYFIDNLLILHEGDVRAHGV